MTSQDCLANLNQWIEEKLPSLRMPAAGFMQHPYLSLGGHYGAGGRTFFWDSFFTVLRAWHSPGNEDAIRGTLECYLDHTDPDSGQVFRVISPRGPMVTSSIEQIQPFLGQLAYVANKAKPITSGCDRVLDLLEAYFEFWHGQRNSAYGLYRWLDAYEAGLDHQVCLGSFLPLTVVAPELNSYCILDLRAAGALASQWGDSARAEKFTRRAEELTDNMRKHLWSDQHGTYCHLDTTMGKHIFQIFEGPDYKDFVLNPWTNFTPLYARVATADQAKQMIEQYLLSEQEFRCAFGLTSLTKRSVFFTEQRICMPTNISFMPLQRTGSNWSGAVWILTNYILSRGMANYGYVDQAKQIALDTAELLLSSIQEDGGMYECYNPRTGKGLWALGVFGWNVLGDLMWSELDTGRFALADLMRT